MSRNPVCWFEIYVHDIKRARTFYETVFKTKLEPLVNPATIAETNMELWSFPQSMTAPGCSGALAKMEGVTPNGGINTIVYFASEDCSVEEARVVKAGGKIQKPKVSLGEYGFMSLAVDTEGNVFGIFSMK